MLGDLAVVTDSEDVDSGHVARLAVRVDGNEVAVGDPSVDVDVDGTDVDAASGATT